MVEQPCNQKYVEMVCGYIKDYLKSKDPGFNKIILPETKFADLGLTKSKDFHDLFAFFGTRRQRPVILIDLQLESTKKIVSVSDITSKACGYIG